MKKSICILLFCLLLFTGCSPKTPDNASSVNSEAQLPQLAAESQYMTLPNDMIAWGLKKNKGAAPEVPDSMVKTLNEFNAVYKSDKEKCLYLTFDEGYENGYSAQILDILKKTSVPAAFFITGDYLKSEGELVKRMTDEGHIVGNHTKNHPSMPSVKNISTLVNEITQLDDDYFTLTGKHMSYFRPPKGEYSERSLAVCKDLGYKTVLWSFAYADWERDKEKGADYAYDQIMPYLHDGAIILLHAVSKDNADALERVIGDARSMGYEFKSLDEL